MSAANSALDPQSTLSTCCYHLTDLLQYIYPFHDKEKSCLDRRRDVMPAVSLKISAPAQRNSFGCPTYPSERLPRAPRLASQYSVFTLTRAQLSLAQIFSEWFSRKFADNRLGLWCS